MIVIAPVLMLKSLFVKLPANSRARGSYSPDMNPIEKAYSKLKAFLRKIAERTVAGLINALDACADIFKPRRMRKLLQGLRI